jgi:hypothetical protein
MRETMRRRDAKHYPSHNTGFSLYSHPELEAGCPAQVDPGLGSPLAAAGWHVLSWPQYPHPGTAMQV